MSDATRSWNAAEIAAAVLRQVFQRRCLLVVPNCSWTGHECDLLGVDGSLRIIDVEIKISRADLRADAGKDKWWRRGISVYAGVDNRGLSRYVRPPDVKRCWPPRVWKHYYCMPADIWRPELLQVLPSPKCGVITVRRQAGWNGLPSVVACRVERRATPDRDAKPISAVDAIDIARLAGLRMWDALRNVQQEAG